MSHDHALSFIRMQVEEGVIPSAGVAIGRLDDVYSLEVFGNACVYPVPEPASADTLYDMASLTKTMATAMVALKLAEQGRISLIDTLGDYLSVPSDKQEITLMNLMTHTSGLPAHILIEEQAKNPEEALALLLNLPLERPPGTEVIYSCLGYIILGKILELAGGAPLDSLSKDMVFEPLNMKSTCFNPRCSHVAATEPDIKTGNYLKGTVHDENARFLGGVAGNAGLFSTVGDSAKFAAMLSRGGQGFLPRPVYNRMVMNHTEGKAESRGLGLSLADGRPLSCGEFFSPGSCGHTGYTGTSIWVNADTRLYEVLLTNAVHFGRERSAFFRARRIFHNLASIEYDR
jgi:CubicO group peptidase (beta-lactamase class C family)